MCKCVCLRVFTCVCVYMAVIRIRVRILLCQVGSACVFPSLIENSTRVVKLKEILFVLKETSKQGAHSNRERDTHTHLFSFSLLDSNVLV